MRVPDKCLEGAYIVGLVDGVPRHTIRYSDGKWQKFWGNVNQAVGSDPGRAQLITCGGEAAGGLHVLVVVGDKVFRTFRKSDGHWTPWKNIAHETEDPGQLVWVAAAGIG